MSRRFIFAAFVLAAFLCGCSWQRIMEEYSSPEDEAVAKRYIDLMRQDKYDEIKKDADPAIRDQLTHELFEKMRFFIPASDPVAVKVVGCSKLFGSNSRTVGTSFEYEYPEEWLLIGVTVRSEGGIVTLKGLEVRPLAGPMEKINAFTFADKGPAHYIMLFFSCVVPLVSVFALFVCWRTKLKRKWLWISFILVGIGKITMNWTTGSVGTSFLSIQLLGVSCFAGPYGPWMLSVSLPLGALVFLYRRRYLQRKSGIS